jgi:hypothetical protein
MQLTRRPSPPSDRLDESKIEQLRAWGEGLFADGYQELRATGKAILLLIEDRASARRPVEREDDAGARPAGSG